MACLLWDLGWVKKPSDTEKIVSRGLFPWIQPASALLQAGTVEFYLGLNPELAKKYLVRAVELQPALVPAWLRLSQLFHQQGSDEQAQKILTFLHRTLKEVSRWRWELFSLALVLDDEETARQNLHRLLEVRPQAADQAFFLAERYWGPAPDLCPRLEPKVLPRYLHYLTARDRTEEAILVWSTMDRMRTAPWDEAVFFLDYLLARKRFEEAVQIWHARGQPWGVTNGGFESPLEEQTFGWRTRKSDGADITREEQGAGEGGFCLGIHFAGTVNRNFRHVYQYIPLGQDRRYKLRFIERAEGLTTDQGVFLEISQAYGPPFHFQSTPLSGTSSWQQVALDVEVPASCQVAVLTVKRKPSHRFDSQIRGSYFLDHVRLEPPAVQYKPSLSPSRNLPEHMEISLDSCKGLR
jgi:tetratricopeptide (TPR) repeat protein